MFFSCSHDESLQIRLSYRIVDLTPDGKEVDICNVSHQWRVVCSQTRASYDGLLMPSTRLDRPQVSLLKFLV